MSKITAEGKKNLPSEAELAKIQRYIERSKISVAIRNRYQLRGHEIFAFGELGLNDPCKSASLAYAYGLAKGYRAAKAEAAV